MTMTNLVSNLTLNFIINAFKEKKNTKYVMVYEYCKGKLRVLSKRLPYKQRILIKKFSENWIFDRN